MPFTHGRFYVPFTKVDREKRIVWGIAQTEEVDTQGDYLPYDASVDAFEKWQGNVREMHDPKAVGRAIRIVADPAAKQIFVGTYISKGAEDTWQKILDGTLRGYSIGGYPLEATREFLKRFGRVVRTVSKYVLEELSLVDTPANSSCVITAVQKRADNTLVATDVLGHVPTTLVAGDVLSSKEMVPMADKRITKRAKIKSLVPFVKKNLGDEKDEVIVVRVSDLKKLADGRILLDQNAPVAKLTKGELEADGYADEGDGEPEGGAVPEIDFGDHATNTALLHHDLCKMAGVDPFEHYEQAVSEPEGGEEGGEGGGEPGESGSDFGKGVGTRRRRNGFRKRRNGAGVDIEQRIAKAVGSANETLANGLDALSKRIDSIASGVAPRPGAAGEPITKSAGEKTELDELNERLEKCYGQRSEFLKASPKDSVELRARESLAKEISDLEVRKSRLQRATR